MPSRVPTKEGLSTHQGAQVADVPALFLRSTLRQLAPLLLCAAVAHAWAQPESQTGLAGTPGANGISPGQSGGTGGAGGAASALQQAVGGSGGTGGNGAGGNATLRGGTAGAGGGGGAALAKSVLSAPTEYGLTISSTGGQGGDAGRPGADAGAGGGLGARGGNGGQATGTLDGSNLDSFYASYGVVATGGAGGAAYGNGGKGGNGGAASGSGRIANPLGMSNLSLQATGGAGGAGLEGADGGDGASTALTNAVSGSGLDWLSLEQSARGGMGGDSTSAVAGRGGDALSELARVSVAEGRLTTWVDAVGGAGGSSSQGMGGAGGAGRATLDVQHLRGALLGTVMASGGAPGDAALRSPAAIAGNAEATGRLVGSAEELTNLSVLATGGEAGQRYDTRNTANRIWLGNGGQATAQGHAEGGGRVWVDVSARGGQGERGGDATATASARGTSPLSNVFVNSSAVSSGGRAQSSAVAELSTNQISTPVRAVATATTSGGSSGANARSTSGYTGERAMVIEATAQSSDASATVHAATGVGGLTERYDTYGPFGYSILIGMPASDQVVLTSRVAQMYADGQTPLLAQGGVGTGPAMTFGKTALSNVGLDARLKTGLADNERAFIGFLNLEQNNVDVPDAVFGTLSFSVDNHGTELFKQDFTSLEEARAYFADRPIVLESVTGDVDLGLHFSVVGALSSGWRINYVIGVIPEPSTQALMALAFGGLFAVRRWQARRAAVAAA